MPPSNCKCSYRLTLGWGCMVRKSEMCPEVIFCSNGEMTHIEIVLKFSHHNSTCTVTVSIAIDISPSQIWFITQMLCSQ